MLKVSGVEEKNTEPATRTTLYFQQTISCIAGNKRENSYNLRISFWKDILNCLLEVLGQV